MAFGCYCANMKREKKTYKPTRIQNYRFALFLTENIIQTISILCIQNSEEEGKKGHSDKEQHEGDYEEKKGHKKKHFDEAG